MSNKMEMRVIDGVLHILKPHYDLEIINREQARMSYAFASTSEGGIVSLAEAVIKFNQRPPQNITIELRELYALLDTKT